jgi:GTP-binding protein LepA
MMDLERERGITIKMQPVRMKYGEYVLNLIDTPGHVDFSYEVSRSLLAVEGAILLVDATKGIQAQTVSNLEMAKQEKLVIIPVINKIDMPQAKVEETENEIAELLGLNRSEILRISAKTGEGVEEVLKAVIEKVPPPNPDRDKLPLRALIFDSMFDSFKGVLAYVRVFDGNIKKGDRVYLMQSGAKGETKEVGIFKPEMSPIESLSAGDIGFIATGVKESENVRVGDTITNALLGVAPLPGYKEPQAKVFLSIYPEISNDFDILKIGLEKLKLNDASLTYKPELKEGLGRGFQCGFLGLLHVEIIAERLRREFGLNLVLSTPSVLYKILTTDNKEIIVHTSADWPDPGKIASSKELWSKLSILTPPQYLGYVMELMETMEVKQIGTNYVGSEKIELVFETPLREIITKNLYDKLKGVSQGFASMSYEMLDWRSAQLVKLDILVLGRKEEALSRIVPEREAYTEGKKIVEKLKEQMPPQLFALPLQAAVGGKVLARETVSAKRKDVIAPLYGGDYTRKRKLLEKQKKGKKELKEKGKVNIPPQVFLEVFKA